MQLQLSKIDEMWLQVAKHVEGYETGIDWNESLEVENIDASVDVVDWPSATLYAFSKLHFNITPLDLGNWVHKSIESAHS